jgi:hypothetical protein
MRSNRSIDTDAQVRPLPSVAPCVCAGHLQLQGLPRLSSKYLSLPFTAFT